MKNILLSLLFVLSFTILTGQVSKSIHLTNAGTLSTELSSEELNSVTNLTITGNIDARDFKTMRDLMPVLAEIDLTDVTIIEVRGAGLDRSNACGEFYPANVFPYDAFGYKGTLTTILLPSSITSIGYSAFAGCDGLSSIILTSSITEIGGSAFDGCIKLTNLEIPSSVTSIYGRAFNNCSGLNSLTFKSPSSLTTIGYRAFGSCSGLTSINLPSSLITIDNMCFQDCSGLNSISIPSNVTSIGAYAFQNCTGLNAVYAYPRIPQTPKIAWINDQIFSNSNESACTLYVPFGTYDLYAQEYHWKNFQNIVEMESTSSSKTVNLTTAGTLSTILSPSELASITKLTITGNIDARDFETMRDLMPLLAEIDLSGATIVAYNPAGDNVNPANTIPMNAFYNTSSLTGKQSLTTFILPSSATTIGSGAFSNCINLLSITIPSSVTEIMGGAFGFCKKLESVNIPKNVTTIGNQAFYFCNASFIVDAENPNYSSVDGVLFDKSKTTIIQCPMSKAGVYTIPSSVTNLGVNAFSGCSSLSEIIVPPLVKEMGYQTFSNCSGLVKINIPNSVHTIQPYAFEFCQKLSSITIPSSVTQIGGAAFRGCIELSSIYALKATPVNLSYSSDVFKDVDKATCILYVPSGSENLYATASQWNEFSNIQSIPVVSKTINLTSPGTLATLLTDTELASVNNLILTGTLDARDFKTMRDLMPALATIDLSAVTIAEYTGTEGTAGSQLTTYPAHEVPRNAFYNKISLTSVSIPVSATTIGRSAFNNCDGLTHVTFGANQQLKTVGYLSFAYCDALTEIHIPSGVTLVDYGAFRQCSALVTCNLPESVKTIGSTAFYQCTKLKNLSIPQAVETIGEFAFYLCREVLSFNVPASAVFVGRGTFIGATGTVMVAENNPNYSSLDGVFYDKNKTRLIYCPPSTTGHFTIPATVTTIVVDAFYNCSQITSFNLPEGLTTLEDWAFENCNSITSLTLPASVISIGNQAFYSCFGLSSFIVNNPVPVDLSSKTDVFSGIDQSTCILYVPAGSKTAYQNAEKWKDFQSVVELTYVPDDNFEQALIDLGYDSGPLDDYVPTANIQAVKMLNIDGKNINDLTGIEEFKALEFLSCTGNNLQQLDVSNNNLLNYLNCNGNKLTKLDVSANILLLTLYCSVNQLSELKLNPGGSLKTLYCNNNLLTNIELENLSLTTIYCQNNLLLSLDLSECKEIKNIYCSNNYLTFLNLKNNNNTIISNMDATGNPYLNCIMVDEPILSSGFSGWKKDENASYSDYCEFIRPKMTYVPDDNFEQALIDLRYDSGTLNDSIPTLFIDNITSLVIEGRDIEDLTGIEDFVALTKLHIAYNKLSSVDLSKNLNLIDLRCSSNPLEELDISKCISLKKIECVSNRLTSIDISANIALQELICADNLMTSIDARNNVKLWGLNASMNLLSSLYLPQNLRSLVCTNNKLANVDFSVVDSLQFLTLDNNNIEILDLSKNGILRSLRCSNNLLKKLNLQNGKNQLIGSIRATGNPNLFCIQVDNPEYSLANPQWLKDPQASYSTSCNNIPTANAGADQTIEEGSTVTLDGSLSADADQDNLTYKWTAPVGITLSSESAQKPTFVAPEVTQDTRFTFYLVVNDGFTDSPTDQVLVTVKQVNKAPVADAGADQTIQESATVTLDGSLSVDADGDSITYKWTTPDGITLSSASAQKPTFIAPEVAEDTQFTFYLVVNDGFADSPADTIVVTVKQANQLPFADAGADQTIEEGATVTLDGSLSSDTDGDNLTYKWTATEGITLSSASVQKPTFIAPEVAEDTQISFYLVVNDGFTDSPADTIVVTVKQVNKAPVADAGANQKVRSGDKVVLDASGSFDPDQDPLVYFWTSLSGITLNSASDPSPFFLAPVTKNETDLIFILTVSDGSALSKTDTVMITVENNSSVISVKTFFDGTVASPEQLHYELYKETNGNFTKVAATFSTENNTSLFNVEAGNWIILAIPVDPETDFIPTYFGNGVTWDEAEIITVQGDAIVDLEINCRKTANEPVGEYSIEGFVYQAEGTKSCVVLSNVTGNNPVPGTKVLLFRENETTPVRTTFTDNEGKYIFSHLNPAEYKVIVDIPGFDQVDVWNIKLDSVAVSVVNVNFTVITSLGVITDIPETELKTSVYPNPTTGKLYLKTENWPHNSKIEVFNSLGMLVYHSLIPNSSFLIDFSDKPDGVYLVNISSNKKKETVKIVLRK